MHPSGENHNWGRLLVTSVSRHAATMMPCIMCSGGDSGAEGGQAPLPGSTAAGGDDNLALLPSAAELGLLPPAVRLPAVF